MGDWNPAANEIFLRAAEIAEPAERSAFLAERCADDPELRAQVDSLLDAREQMGSFLKQPALGATVYPADNCESPVGAIKVVEEPGAVIGPYKLLERIGEGGFGVVFLAEQSTPVRRKVALKVLKAGMDTRQVVARFEAERQALAIMDHPNIARVFDGGATDSGRPYFVMEYVKGAPLTEFCDRHHLDPSRRLELFVVVCQAVQHAHQKGIIHRDLKPSNILVSLHDVAPVVKVIDFGIAKALGQELTDKTLFTGAGQMIGTPLYMSPEQAGMSDLDVDTRGDIYSLGVLLYELLTGTTPFTRDRFKRAAYDEIRRIIREEDPPKPSTRLSDSTESLPSIAANRSLEPRRLSGLLRGELDWIVMKALEKDRNRRYQTANGFAADVQRYLNAEAVLAAPPSAWYRLRKTLRRHKGPVFTASLVLLSLVGGVVGTSWGLFKAKAANSRETKSRERAEVAEAETLKAFQASTDDAIQQLIGSKPELTAQDRAYLERTLQRWQAFADRHGDDERSTSIRGEGHYRVGLLWQMLGRWEESRREFETACELIKGLASTHPSTPAHRANLGKVHDGLGTALRYLGKPGLAKTNYQAALDLHKALSDESPDTPLHLLQLAKTNVNLGNLLRERGEPNLARTSLETARRLLMELTGKHPAVAEYQLSLFTTCDNLGKLLSETGERDAARREFETARDLLRKLLEKDADNPVYQRKLALSHHSMGTLLATISEGDAARREFVAARDMHGKLHARFPGNADYGFSLSAVHNELAGLLADRGEWQGSRTEYEAARDLIAKLHADFPAVHKYEQYLAKTHCNLGFLLSRINRSNAAKVEYAAAIDRFNKLIAKDAGVPEYRGDLAHAHNNFGLLLAGLGERAAAREHYDAAVVLRRELARQFPKSSAYKIHLGGTLCNIAILLVDEDKTSESLNWFDQAIAALDPVQRAEPRNQPASRFLFTSHRHRAMARDRLKKHADADRDWNRTFELCPAPEHLTLRAIRANSKLNSGLLGAAVAEAAELSASTNWTAEEWYDLARIYSVASGKIADKKPEYAAQAMELLRRAVEAGWKNAARMEKDKDLDAIRNRDDFTKLVEEVEVKNKPK